MTRLPDHFSRRLDGRAGDMAQLPEPRCPQRWTWEHYALGLLFVGPALWAGYLILK